MKIGVIGGNGVAATNRLCDIIERKLTMHGAFRDAHHPEMIVWQATKAPSRSMFLEGRGPDWIPDYIDIAKKMRLIGCDLACMCCNTAHYAIHRIEEESGLPFINLLESVALAAKKTGCSSFEVFCSDGARKYDIYGEAFRRLIPEAQIIYPSEARQKMITKVICDVKTRKRFEKAYLLPILEELVGRANAPVIIGCTDISVVYPNGESAVRGNVCVDSLETLADSIIERYDSPII